MFSFPEFPDARPRYPERLAVQVPIGMRAQVRRAAEAERTTAGELIRQAIEARLRQVPLSTGER